MENMEDEDKILVLICMPCAAGPSLAEANKDTCSICGQDIWVSHSGLKDATEVSKCKGSEISLNCIVCAIKNHPDWQSKVGMPGDAVVEDCSQFIGKSKKETARLLHEKLGLYNRN